MPHIPTSSVRRPSNDIQSLQLDEEEEEEETPLNPPTQDSLRHIDSFSTVIIPRDDHHPMFGIARRPVAQSQLQQQFLGPFTYRCSSCHALHWKAELPTKYVNEQSFLMCCHHGKIAVLLLQQPPPPLYEMYTSQTATAKSFRENIVQYNSALAFTSLGVSVDRAINAQPGPPVFRVHGELMHWSGCLLSDNETPSYAQLYVYDPQQALAYRMARNSNLNEGIMQALQHMVITYNSYYRLYLHTFEILQQRDVPDMMARMVTLPHNDGRRNNLPVADEVAVILPETAPTVEASSRDIILTLRRHAGSSSSSAFPLQRISEGHAAYAPTHYVLLFPHGEAGWHWDLYQCNSPRKLTLCQYVSFRLHGRGENTEFSTILRGGRLLQHYIVDMYACIDQSRLLYHRTHQHQYRMASASGMHDALHPSDDVIGNQRSLSERLSFIGQKVLLPSSYIGGPRDMYERYQDGMALARFYKQMDLFITMTANPNWSEIRDALLPGQNPSDRPDIIARVFHLKHKHFLHAVVNDMIFGKCLAYVYTVEFQKRGLPHCHYLLTLASPYKLLTPEAVDSAISASWPNPDNDPILFDLVKKHMIHGPCGLLNPHAPCMVNGKCSKGYPKPFQDATSIDLHGYPHYQRKNDGRAYEVGRHAVDNCWIVPHNKYLLQRYSAHINVKCSIYFGCLAYILKYFKKLRDTGTLQLRNPDDEIERYIQGRYYSAVEAAWHEFQFEIHGQSPSVMRLPIHLPFEQPILFDTSESSEVLELRAHLENSPLMAFFHANADTGHLGEEARKFTYPEFPQHFVLKTERSSSGGNRKYWDIRQQHFSLGRMAFVKPASGERFYLRLLLLQCKGPTSFDSLKEWPPNSGIILPTFYDTCAARGLLEDDNEWRTCLEEASAMKTGSQLRHLFSTLLLFCDINQPHILWADFKRNLCSDLHYRFASLLNSDPCEALIEDYGLYLIDLSLQDSGHCLFEYSSMPQSQHPWDVTSSNPWIADQLAFDRVDEATMAAERVAQLNDEQHHAFTTIYETIVHQQPALFFLNGPAGTGKTFLYEALCHSIRSQGWIVICVASTGVAALLLPKGRTAHSVFKIPITTLTADSVCSITKNSPLANLFRQTRAIIWDESVMSHRWIIESVNRTLQDICDSTEIMAGIVTVLGGDWNQCLPVIEQGSREDTVNACLQRSSLWSSVRILKLSINMRLRSSHNYSFSTWLRKIGDGTENDDNSDVSIPQENVTLSCDQLLYHVYGDVLHATSPPLPTYFLSRCILAPQNTTVDDINNNLLSTFPGRVHECISADTILPDDENPSQSCDIGPDDLHSFNFPNFPPAELKLKIGCPLILLRNLNPSQGLCNGTRMVLLAADDRVLEVQILTGNHVNERAFIPRISLHPQSACLPFNFRRRQFPIRLCFSMTINKSEGQTFNTLGIDLRCPVFSHGQLYVAFSRGTTQSQILALLSDTLSDTKVPNIVYPEVILP